MPFEYIEMGADFKPVKTRTVEQSKMTGECWLVQFNGLDACKDCENLGKKGCGGQDIRKTGKNKKGFAVPI